MEPTSAPTRSLSTAEQRRGELIDAAVRVFAARGYGAPTTEIAREAGISQAYLFRLFPTKDELFAAAGEETKRRMMAAFRDAARRAREGGEDPLEAMGKAYGELLDSDRDVLLVQLHCQVAASDSEAVRDSMRKTFADLYELVAGESGAPMEELRAWFAHGMLCNVMAAIDADHLDMEWAKALTKNEDV
jgi:AcrR family transcriptional regulator